MWLPGSISWLLLSPFQWAEFLKLKKVTNANKLPAGFLEGRGWVGHLRQCQVVPGRRAWAGSRLHQHPDKKKKKIRQFPKWLFLALIDSACRPGSWHPRSWLGSYRGWSLGKMRQESSLVRWESLSSVVRERRVVGNTKEADPREETRKQHVLSPRQEAAGQWLCMCAKLLQLYLTLWNPVDCSLPGSSDHGIL